MPPYRTPRIRRTGGYKRTSTAGMDIDDAVAMAEQEALDSCRTAQSHVRLAAKTVVDAQDHRAYGDIMKDLRQTHVDALQKYVIATLRVQEVVGHAAQQKLSLPSDVPLSADAADALERAISASQEEIQHIRRACDAIADLLQKERDRLMHLWSRRLSRS